MSSETVGPLSRPFLIGRLPDGGSEVQVTASAEECSALAADLGLRAVPALSARLRITGTRRGVRVRGRVEARIVQTCVVSLDEFESRLDEEVDVSFEEPDTREPKREAAIADPDYDPPDEIVDGRIDLGSIVAEFLALGLDPYPRKPGVRFDEPAPEIAVSPFASLAKLAKE